MWDHTQFYVLGEAYWRIGRAIHGDHWTGFEINYGPNSDLETLKVQKANALRDFELAQDQAKFLRANPPDSDSAYAAYRDTIMSADEQLAKARLRRDQFDEALRVPLQDDGQYQRRIAAECRLVDAFKNGTLQLVAGAGLVVDWNEWVRHSTFRVNFGQSLIYAPLSLAGRRRSSAYIQKSQFDAWFFDQSDFVQLVDPRTDEERAALWLERKAATAERAEKRDSILHDMEKSFPGLTERARLRVWGKTAPDSWKKPGPKSKQ